MGFIINQILERNSFEFLDHQRGDSDPMMGQVRNDL